MNTVNPHGPILNNFARPQRRIRILFKKLVEILTLREGCSRYAAALILIFAIFFFSCKVEKKQTGPAADDIIPVRVMPVKESSTKSILHVSGRFTTDDESNLSFKNGGIIHAIYVKEGDQVHKGQVLAVLDMTEIESITGQANAALTKAERDYERAKNLYRDSVATLEQMQNARTALDVARQQLANAQFNKQSAVLRATQSGYVLNKFAQEGQVVGPGMPVVRINGASQDKWLLKAGVSDRQWSAAAIGDPASITTDVFPDEKIEGKVISKSQGTDPMTGTFTLTISVDGKSKRGLASGLFGKAEIQTGGTMAGWAIPFSALMEGDPDSGYVFVAGADHVARRVRVGVGKIEKDQVIVSAAWDSTTKIVVTGSAYLTDGSAIKIVE